MTAPALSRDRPGAGPLEAIIRAEIAARGPISVAEYMALALGHPEYGYYMTRDPLGTQGDFTTAPEVSQMFGEMIGLWLAERLEHLGRPAPALVELGPGRGTLMVDALRAAAPLRALPLWLVETSPVLRAAQTTRLPGATHAAAFEEVPEGPILLIANEFLDALPVHQFVSDGAVWREIRVGLDANGALARGLSAQLPGRDCAPKGSWAEESPTADRIVAEAARRIAAHGGAALFVDYGYDAADRPAGPTLQALRGHARADALEEPGMADLTWLPDFDRLARLAADAAPVTVHRSSQGAFLAALGIGQRAASLAARIPSEAGTIADALERLCGPGEGAMGTRFKVLAITPSGATPPGFAEPTPSPGDAP
ncbi:MAG: SAM-dependent methyltransferase [Pseudomonadota bacterium]